MAAVPGYSGNPRIVSQPLVNGILAVLEGPLRLHEDFTPFSYSGRWPKRLDQIPRQDVPVEEILGILDHPPAQGILAPFGSHGNVFVPHCAHPFLQETSVVEDVSLVWESARRVAAHSAQQKKTLIFFHTRER